MYILGTAGSNELAKGRRLAVRQTEIRWRKIHSQTITAIILLISYAIWRHIKRIIKWMMCESAAKNGKYFCHQHEYRGPWLRHKTTFSAQWLMRMWHAPEYGGLWAFTWNSFAISNSRFNATKCTYWQPFNEKKNPYRKTKHQHSAPLNCFIAQIVWSVKNPMCCPNALERNNRISLIACIENMLIRLHGIDWSTYCETHKWNWETCGWKLQHISSYDSIRYLACEFKVNGIWGTCTTLHHSHATMGMPRKKNEEKCLETKNNNTPAIHKWMENDELNNTNLFAQQHVEFNLSPFERTIKLAPFHHHISTANIKVDWLGWCRR